MADLPDIDGTGNVTTMILVVVISGRVAATMVLICVV